MTLSVLLDTCVLFPMYLRDSLLRLAAADLYRPHWSPQILAELHRVLSPPLFARLADGAGEHWCHNLR
ncbi:PIN domain-containing protein [Hamadaea sp. NPDC051192]|uniref:PIN domain-containing protein n=1 Tax=Hamadaea sp. NPDC051192 TaxID=3154940 RepID=UPI003425A204